MEAPGLVGPVDQLDWKTSKWTFWAEFPGRNRVPREPQQPRRRRRTDMGLQ